MKIRLKLLLLYTRFSQSSIVLNPYLQNIGSILVLCEPQKSDDRGQFRLRNYDSRQ